MKTHLIEMFHFNMDANIKLVSTIRAIPDNQEMLLHLSHLANCQYKWLGRIISLPEADAKSWWEPVYTPDVLVEELQRSTQHWLDYLNHRTEETLEDFITFQRGTAGQGQASLKDIALQLIFHSFHHRAQIQTMIREKGITPEGIDYIRSRITKKGES